MAVLDIGELMVRFPDFRVGLVVAAGLAIPPDPPEVRRFLAATEAACRAALGDGALADIPELRCWREANKAFGVKKTSYRSSVERLLKGAQRGAGLPRVNALVDLYNAVSAAHRMPVGADDLDLVRPALELVPGRPQRDRADDRQAVLTVQALAPTAARLEQAAAELCRLLAAHCGARCDWRIADRANPRVEAGERWCLDLTLMRHPASLDSPSAHA